MVMASSGSTLAQYLCVVTIILCAGSHATPEESVQRVGMFDDVESTILAHIESQLADIKDSLARLDRLHALNMPLQGMYEGHDLEARPDMGSYDKRFDTNAFYGVRGRRAHDSSMTDARRQLLDYIRLYDRKHSAYNEPTPVGAKRQPPTGFHAIRGRRSQQPRDKMADKQEARRAAFFKGFSAVRGR